MVAQLSANQSDTRTWSKIKKFFAGILFGLEQDDFSEILKRHSLDEYTTIKLRQMFNYNLRKAQILLYSKTYAEAIYTMIKLNN